MRRAILLTVLGALVAVSPLHAQEVLPPPGPTGDRAWADADLLLWWMRGTTLPPLVTTSPPGTPINQAGVLGNPSTTVLFGNSAVNGSIRVGGRVEGGYWFNDDQTVGVQADFFMLATKASNFSAVSGGSPILARPFTDANSGSQASERIAFPGDVTGSVQASAGSTGLIGTGILLRERIFSYDYFRLDVVAGYRYLRFADNLGVTEDLTNVNPNNPNFIPPGANILVTDRFATTNNLNAFDVGFVGTWRGGPLRLDVRTKLAVGYNYQDIDINGSTTVTVPGVAPVVNSGGLLALSSNSGLHHRKEVSLVPQLDAKLAYQITPRLSASVGYTFLYWSNVARAADQVDTTVNATLVPPVVAPAGPARPALTFQQKDLWAQGIQFGLEYVF
jgi:hypothetical protein